MVRARLIGGITIVSALACAPSARAQTDTLGYATSTPAWVGHFTTLSANAVLGGITGGIIQELRGGSFQDGFTRGALGGTIIYAGKWVAARRFYGAGFLGREVGAVGASVVRNASDGIGNFDRLILPAGFTRIYWNRASRNVSVKVDVYSAGMVAYGVLEDELDLDASASLSAGTFVFKTNNEVIVFGDAENHAAGVSRAGIILRSDVPAWGDEFLDRAFAHERAHVLQDDQLFITLNDHLDDWLLSKAPATRSISSRIDLNASSEFLRLLAKLIPRHADRPWELEAIYLTR